jgi:hypothetical protein
MKETQPHKADEIAIVKQVQVKHNKFLGTLIPENGHTLFEFDKTNFELRKATFKQKNAVFKFVQDAGPDLRKEVIVKENCFYVSSLNIKNAVKKIHKRFNGAYVIAINE